MTYPVELERLINRELRRLPAPRAPQSLLPRVLTGVERWTARPWYTREWFAWPPHWQFFSVAMLTSLVAVVAWLLPSVTSATIAVVSPTTAQWTNQVTGVTDRVRVFALAADVLWRALFQPIAGFVFALVVLMCLACFAFAASLNQAIGGRAIQR